MVSRSRGTSSQGESALWTERVCAGAEGTGRSGAGHVTSWQPQCERRESHTQALFLCEMFPDSPSASLRLLVSHALSCDNSL